ncbi:tripartite tricarboxylate transporter substrate-binding protein [Acidovorax sp. LjRoot129]|uniref:Bug family tripartite tricarboxylate transporter substrate binding protein n=1 Tax=Acidovorax sp. LjRoot129 TaxID=3342260 RepID=UPI003ED10CF7
MTKGFLTRRELLQTVSALALPAISLQSSASGWPDRPIRFVVPSAAGGSPDAICRVLATELSASLNQPVEVANQPGDGGSAGMLQVFHAAPDGYTVGYGNVVTLAINRHIYRRLAYDPDKFTGIALLGTVQNALIVRDSISIKTVQELVTFARSKPGQLTMGSAGNGTTGHLGGELFKILTDTNITHIPYRGSSAAFNDLLSGKIDLMFDNLSSCGSHIKAQRVRALGVSGAKRAPTFPQIPTIQESGVKGFETTSWGGVVGPPGVPGEVVTRLNSEINRILTMPAVRERYKEISFESMASVPNLIMTMAMIESKKWERVIAKSGTKLD